MSTIADRLRGIVRSGGGSTSGGSRKRDAGGSAEQDPPYGGRPKSNSRQRRPGPVDPAGISADPASAAAVLDGDWVQAGQHRFLVVERSYAPGHRHGSVSVADGLPPEEGWSRLGLLAGRACGQSLLFVDLETTGLAGGAGSYAFLVGCGWFECGTFSRSPVPAVEFCL